MLYRVRISLRVKLGIMQEWEKCEFISLEFDGICGKVEFDLDLMQNIWCNALQMFDTLWI